MLMIRVILVIVTAIYIALFINALYKDMSGGQHGRKIYLWLLGIPTIIGLGYLIT